MSVDHFCRPQSWGLTTIRLIVMWEAIEHASPGEYGPIDQIGYLVDNLDASIQRWIAHMGVGPWTVKAAIAAGRA